MNQLLLIGGGHAHLSILRSIIHEEKTKNYNITLISPSRYQYYSGMFSGFTEGFYSEENVRIDLEDLCKKASVTFIKDTVTSIEPQQKSVLGVSEKYTFDIVSFDIGSTDSDMFKPFGLNIKPNFLFTEKIESFRSSEKPLIIGGGSAGVELALSVIAWRERFNKARNVTLISSSPLLSTYGKAATKKINAIAKEKGLTVFENQYIKEIQQGKLITDKKCNIDFSCLLPLTGPSASMIFKQSGLQTDRSGFLLINDSLQSVSHPFIFGAGDCVSLRDHQSLPKNGVYAVRQGPMLWENIKRNVHGNALLSFKPQKKFVSILSTGNKSALFTYGKIAIKGNWAWRLKNKIDTQFIRKHQGL